MSWKEYVYRKSWRNRVRKKPQTAADGGGLRTERASKKSPELSSRGKNGYDKILIVISGNKKKKKKMKRKNEKKSKGPLQIFQEYIIMTMFFHYYILLIL